MRTLSIRGAIAPIVLFAAGASSVAARGIELDPDHHRATISAASGSLVLGLEYAEGCAIDRVSVFGREELGANGAATTAIELGSRWSSSRDAFAIGKLECEGDSLVVRDLRFRAGDLEVVETWRFEPRVDSIRWTIERTLPTDVVVDDTAIPRVEFAKEGRWTGAFTGFGGVAWFRLFAHPNASWGVHDAKATIFDAEGGGERGALRIEAKRTGAASIASRYTREPSDAFSFSISSSETERAPKYALDRFIGDKQDVWTPFAAKRGTTTVELELSAVDFEREYGRGTMPGVDGAAVSAICDTIARIGPVDATAMGSNGFLNNTIVLHEPWLAQLGLAIDDRDYDRAFENTVDFWREHAESSDGRLKSRWSGHTGDEMPGSYDALGFYECQWGWLLDTQPDFVINVAEAFDRNGDRAWLAKQKSACERALDYLLARDSDGDGLVEMIDDSCSQSKSSDWIDVVWAAHENALVNAQMYCAMMLWAEDEALLGDDAQASRYRAAARKLKESFNRDVADGGLWDPAHSTFAYWREKDGSIHGTNGVVPVDFSAIGYGLCDDPTRRAAILERIERSMQAERLFFWPLCFTSFAPGEANPFQYPFPNYENGDLFLAWGELGVRCYAETDPKLALKYVNNVLARYRADGLAFQRYLRNTQSGAGEDILANNASAIVGLYRDLYGIQPKWNRLCIDPHLAPELSGAKLEYELRGVRYRIELATGDYAVASRSIVLRAHQPFAADIQGPLLRYFHGANSSASLWASVASAGRFELEILDWPAGTDGVRRWNEIAGASGSILHRVTGLEPATEYELRREGVRVFEGASDANGELQFLLDVVEDTRSRFDLVRC